MSTTDKRVIIWRLDEALYILRRSSFHGLLERSMFLEVMPMHIPERGVTSGERWLNVGGRVLQGLVHYLCNTGYCTRRMQELVAQGV